MKNYIYALLIAITAVGTIWLQDHLNVYDWMFRDMDYQKNIEINSFVITKDQLTNYFCRHERPQQILPKDLAFKDNCFLLVEVKNRGKRDCWGTLECYVLGAQSALVPIIHPAQSREENGYSIYVSDLGRVLYMPQKEAVLAIYKWKDLYTK